MLDGGHVAELKRVAADLVSQGRTKHGHPAVGVSRDVVVIAVGGVVVDQVGMAVQEVGLEPFDCGSVEVKFGSLLPVGLQCPVRSILVRASAHLLLKYGRV